MKGSPILWCVATVVFVAGISCEELQKALSGLKHQGSLLTKIGVNQSTDETTFTSCGTRFTDQTGTITSPDYPNSYPGHLTSCEYHIEVQKGSTIGLSFTSFTTECFFDKLKIYDGPSALSPLIQTITGACSFRDLVPPSSSNKLYIIFITDASNNYSGWSLTYSTIPNGALTQLLPCACALHVRRPAGPSACFNHSNQCNNGPLLHQLPQTYINITAGWKGCVEFPKKCAPVCGQHAETDWGDKGLEKLITIEAPGGPVQITRGQHFCELMGHPINPPGRDIHAIDSQPDCGIEYVNRKMASLCCILYTIPGIGQFLIADYNCDGNIETNERAQIPILNAT